MPLHLTSQSLHTYSQGYIITFLVESYPLVTGPSIANALQLEAARRRAVPIRFNFVARAKFEVTQPVRCHLRAFFLLIRYVTL